MPVRKSTAEAPGIRRARAAVHRRCGSALAQGACRRIGTDHACTLRPSFRRGRDRGRPHGPARSSPRLATTRRRLWTLRRTLRVATSVRGGDRCPDSQACRTWPASWPGRARLSTGRDYRRARRGAFQRSGGKCQVCGLFPAAEAHHWAWRYPADADISADDLTALCRRCHWWATLLRLTGRAQAGVWFILATGRLSVGAASALPASAAQLPGPARPTASRPATRSPEPNLHALITRCHLVLVVGCLACERYVRLDAVLSHRPCWRSMSVTQLCRRLCCCRCRSRTRWVLLGGWPPAEPGGSAEHLRRDGAERVGHGPDRADPDGCPGDAGSRHAKRRHHEGAAAEVVGRDLAVTTAPRPARWGVAVPPARPERRAAVTPDRSRGGR